MLIHTFERTAPLTPRPSSPVSPPALPIPSVDTYAREDAELQMPTYGKRLRETLTSFGSVVAAVGAVGAVFGGIVVSSGLLLRSLMEANLAVAGMSLLGLCGSVALGSALGRSPEAKPTTPAAERELSPSPILGGSTPRKIATDQMSAEDPDLYNRVLPGCYEHPGGAYTWGYKGETLGHMHADALVEARKTALHALSARMQGHINLGLAAASGGGALLCAMTGATLPAAGLVGLTGLLVAAAKGCRGTEATSSAVSAAHTQNAGKLESFAHALAVVGAQHKHQVDHGSGS